MENQEVQEIKADLAIAKAELQQAKSNNKEDLIITLYQLINTLNQRLLQARVPTPPEPVITGLLQLSVESEHTCAYKHYAKIAKIMHTDESVKGVERLISRIDDSDSSNPPFIFIEGSSGSGKTQMAFNVMSLLQLRHRIVWYLVASEFGAYTQSIYCYYKFPSKFFQSCAAQDVREIGDVTPDALRTQKSYTFGYICLFLSETRQDDLSIQSVAKESYDTVQNILSNRSPPVVILDEFLCTLHHEQEFLARFMRNIFRCLRFPVIILGTDARAANLRTQIGQSSSDLHPQDWCYVYGSLPLVNTDALCLPDFIDPGFEYILAHSRPRFSQIAAEFMRSQSQDRSFDADCFDSLRKEVYSSTVRIKPFFKDPFGCLGQVRLFMNASYPYQDEVSSNSAQLMHSHFASLEGAKEFTIKANGHVDDKEWKPKSVFPSMDEDVLLYASLMGGRDMPAFQNASNRIPFVRFLDMLMTSNLMSSCNIVFDNYQQPANDGMFLEAVMTATICMASHANGVRGGKLREFLTQLAYELTFTEQTTLNAPLDIDFQADVNIEFMAQFTIPFLSPPNLIWPVNLSQISGCVFGNLFRTNNARRLDLSSDCCITGEAKDYKTPIKIGVMTQIIERIPHDSLLHFVFVRELQKSYFRSRAQYNSVFEVDSIASKCVFAQLRILPCQQPTLVEVKGLPKNNPQATCAVVFVVCSSLPTKYK